MFAIPAANKRGRISISIRWRIVFAFLAIIGSAFYLAAASLTGLVGHYLLTNRANQEGAAVRRFAAEIALTFEQRDSDGLVARMSREGERLGGRLIALDMDGRVQADTLNQLNGVMLAAPEAADILVGGVSSYGLHRMEISQERVRRTWLDWLRPSTVTSGWSGTFAAPMETAGGRVGAVVYMTSVQDMADQLVMMQDQILAYFLLFALAGLILSLFFSGLITKPIASLTAGIERMARGDLSSRVKVVGGGEMSHLAKTFNQMSEKLENLDDTRSQFVSNASHELKTPLSTMKILLESMIYEPDMDKAMRQEFLGDINKEIDRLTMITSDLLTLVRNDSGEAKLRRESFKFSDAVRDTARRLAPLIQQRDQEVTYTLSDELHLFADRAKISQMVYNLLENAIKYTPVRGKIKVRLVRDGKTALLSITDSGMGIPLAEQPRVFDRFYRVDKARSRSTGGTGLGLSIVKQIVLLHDGDITVASEDGKGSTFSVTLPTV